YRRQADACPGMRGAVQPAAQRADLHPAPPGKSHLKPCAVRILPAGQERDRIGGQELLDRLGETVLVADARRELVWVVLVQLRRIGGGDRLLARLGQLLLGTVEGVVVEAGVAGDVDAPAGGQRVLLVSVTPRQWAPRPAHGTSPAPKVTWRRPRRGGSPAARPADGSNRGCHRAPDARSRARSPRARRRSGRRS